MTGTYIHADGSPCHDGIDPDSLDILDCQPDGDDDEITPPPRIRCQAGRLVAGFRLDPGTPAPELP